jgi:DNA-binding response OmpR family regulator
MRILIVEDEPMIAFDLQDMLEDAGFIVAGVAGKLERALALVTTTAFDAAIVDANLGGVSSVPIAKALATRDVPFIILSGYSLKTQQAGFPDGVFLQKPCRPEVLIRTLKTLQSLQ